MPLLKDDKKALAKKYLESLKGAKNAVLVQQNAIPVNEINKVRIGLAEVEGKMVVVKKRVFLKGIENEFSGVALDKLEGSVAVLYSYNEEDQHAPLKVINKFRNEWKKKKKASSFGYIGGWYDSVWQDAEYVGELADLPSKEELVGKFLFLLNHPVSSFARAIQAIADKGAEGEGIVEGVNEVQTDAAEKEEKMEESADIVAEASTQEGDTKAEEAAPKEE